MIGMIDFQHLLTFVILFWSTLLHFRGTFCGFISATSPLRMKLTEKRLLFIQGRFYSIRNDAGYHVTDRREKNKKNISMECLLFTFSIFET